MTHYIFVFAVIAVSVSTSSADIGWADSPSFYLDLLSFTKNINVTSDDSPTFALNLLGIHRGWADSAEFWICIKYGDFDSDCCVNLADLDEFIGHWLETGCAEPNWCNWADFEKSGSVDFIDFALLAENWLMGCQD
jgi:hypothetical protein